MLEETLADDLPAGAFHLVSKPVWPHQGSSSDHHSAGLAVGRQLHGVDLFAQHSDGGGGQYQQATSSDRDSWANRVHGDSTFEEDEVGESDWKTAA